MSPGQFELLIFDWDGTLADSEALIVSAMRAAITDLGLGRRSQDQIRNIIGLGLQEAAAVLFPDLTECQHGSLADSYRHHYAATAAGKTALFPEVRETLHQLHQQGYKMAVATGKSRRGLDNSLRETGMTGFFNMTRCADETCSKPHPRMLHEIMESLAAAPGATLMIGDSEYDLQMAKHAGIAAMAVSYGTQSRERLLEQKPLGCLDRLAELIPWLSCNNTR